MDNRLDSKFGRGRRKFFSNLTISAFGFLAISSLPFGNIFRKNKKTKLLKTNIHPLSIKRNN